MKGDTIMGHDCERVVAGQLCPGDIAKVREAICILTEKVYDQSKEKDCIENARVYFPNSHWIQRIIDNAINVKVKTAEILDVYADVQPVPFKRGFYTVDIKYFIKVDLNFFIPKPPCGTAIIPVSGLIVYDKKVILFGSEGGVKVFNSDDKNIDLCNDDDPGFENTLPLARVEVAEPVGLTAKIADRRTVCVCNEEYDDDDEVGYHQAYMEVLGNEFAEEHCKKCGLTDERCSGRRHKVVLASVGLFSIVKLVRNVQVLIPAFDFCVPNRPGLSSTDENPCEIFDTIDFPVDEFFPPQKHDFPGGESLE